MTIAGPQYLTDADDISLKGRKAAQSFTISGGDRSLHSVKVKLNEAITVASSNYIQNPNFTANPLTDTIQQPYEIFTNSYTPVWVSGSLKINSWPIRWTNALSLTTYAYIKTRVKNAASAPLQLPAGTAVSVTLNMANSNTSDRTFNIRIFNDKGTEFFQPSFSALAGAAATDYTYNFVTTKEWNEVYIEIQLPQGTLNTHYFTIYGLICTAGYPAVEPISIAICEDNDGKPGRVLSWGEYSGSNQLVPAAVKTEYEFLFPDAPFIEDGKTYHILVSPNAQYDAEWFGTSAAGFGIYVYGDSAGSSYADGKLIFLSDGSDWDTSPTDGDLYFIITYEDVALNNNLFPLSVTWPSDCNDQIPVVDNLLGNMESAMEYLEANTRPSITLYLKTEPTLLLWQAEWIRQGKTLPLPNNIQLLWWNPETNVFGGEYTYINSTLMRVDVEPTYGMLGTYTYSGDYGVGGVGYVRDFLNGNNQITFGNLPRCFFPITLKYPSQLYFRIMLVWPMTTAITTLHWAYAINNKNIAVEEFGILDASAGVSGLLSQSVVAASITLEKDATPFHGVNWLHKSTLYPGSYSVDIVWWSTVADATHQPFQGFVPYSGTLFSGTVQMPYFASYELRRVKG
jgi:hypothetical protein